MTSRSTGPRDLDRIARDLIEAARPTDPFAGARLERGWRRLVEPLAPSRARPGRRRAWLLWAPALVVCLAGVAASSILLDRAPPAPRPAPAPRVSPPPVRPSTDDPSTVPVAPPPIAPVTRPATSPARPMRASAPARASNLAREAALLGRALAALRQQAAPAEALAALDAYEGEFPRGILKLEAIVARVDAHLALGQHEAALTLLDRLAVGRLPRRAELSIIRGELRAQRGRCPDAIGDFDRGLAAGPSPDLRARALHGRGVCRWRLGQRAPATADLESYLEMDPRGRFADSVRALLNSAGPR